MDTEKTNSDLSSSTFDDAVYKAGNGRLQILVLLTTSLGLLAVVVEGLNMAIVLPDARCELNMSTGEQGLINAVAFIGVVLTSQLWGFLSDTWGRRNVLLVALGAGFAFSALSSFSVNTAMLLVTRLLVGLTISGVQAAGISYLGEFHSNATRARHVIFAAMSMSMTVVYQPIMGLFIMPQTWSFSLFGWMTFHTWRMYILISSCVSLLAFIGVCFLPESPKFMLAMNRPDECLRILRTIYARNGLGRKEDYPVQSVELEALGSRLSDIDGVRGVFRIIWKQTRPLGDRQHIGNVLLMCFLAFVVYMVSHGFYMWYPQVLSMYYPHMNEPITVCEAVAFGFAATNARRLSDEVTASDSNDAVDCPVTSEPLTYYIILIMGVTIVLIFCFIALNAHRFAMKYLITFWMVLSTLTALALVWTNEFYANNALLILMVTCGICGSMLSVLSADLFPTYFRGMALCVIMMSGRIGAVAGSNIVGALLDGNCEAIFGIYTGFLGVSIVACYYILQKLEGKTNSKVAAAKG